MEIVVTDILAFAATNVDDLFLLTLFFSNPTYSQPKIIVGQLTGITILIALSLLGCTLGYLISPEHIGLMGLFPTYLGIKQLVSFARQKHDKTESDYGTNLKQSSIVISVAMVTLANGGDNIGIYIPLFLSFNVIEKTIAVGIFLAMTFLWCFAAKYLANHPVLKTSIGQYTYAITPIVLILLGIFILYESNAWNLVHVF